MKKYYILLIALFIAIAIGLTQITIFVVQPIGAVPDGKTLVIWKLNKMNFIDSADGMCEREMGGVSLFCRGAMLSTVTTYSKILLRLPYSETLYSISTNGSKYSR